MNEGAVDRKYIALKPYIRNINLSKVLKEQQASTQESRVLVQRSESKPIQKTVKVLCVDDSSYNLFLMKELLSSMSHLKVDLDTAMHGKEAIQKVCSAEIIYDFIFMDLHMPVMDGFEVSTISLIIF